MDVHEAANRLLACRRVSHEPETVRQPSLHQPTDVGWHKEIKGGREYICLDEEEEEDTEAEHIGDQQILEGLVVVELDSTDEGEKEDEDDEEEEMLVRSKGRLEAPELDEDEDAIELEAVVEANQAVSMERVELVEEKNDASPIIVKRQLDEEDAAFLLFYGDRQTPSASNLRLIIDNILNGVGASSSFYSTVVKYVLWRKLSQVLQAGLVSQRFVQAEWTKIVFSCPVPPHRRRSGPMPRQTLLPRPVTITARPLQFIQKTMQHSTLSVVNGGAETALKQEAVSSHAPSEEMAPTLQKSPRRRSRKRPLAATFSKGMATKDQPVVLSPRKHRRKNGKKDKPFVLPCPVVSAKSPSFPTTSSTLLEPLPFFCYTLGENRSLPIGWRASSYLGEQGSIETSMKVRPVEVNPMLQMTADEIAQHIASLRREGCFTSFEKVTDTLLKLMSDPRNRHGVFNTPVDPVAFDLPTYTTIVKRPMDLGTIGRKLAAGEYLELEDIIADVRLVFENAMLFNHESHYIHVVAHVLLKRFNESVKRN